MSTGPSGGARLRARISARIATFDGRRSARGAPPPHLELVTRAGCGLCLRAEELVAVEAGDAAVRVRDVDAAERDMRRFGVLVPVILVDGEQVAELEVMAGDVRRALRRARRRRALGPEPSGL